jgi:hypothetical protein
MTSCRGCGQSLSPTAADPALRGGESSYHLRCAPDDLLATAAEEYRAIVRKGVRYFVEKYGGEPLGEGSVAQGFLALGDAVEEERRRRGSR